MNNPFKEVPLLNTMRKYVYYCFFVEHSQMVSDMLSSFKILFYTSAKKKLYNVFASTRRNSEAFN